MAANAFTTAGDLRLDALWMAGEPAGSTGAFFERALDLINVVYTSLLAGGALGAITIPKVDWWWARSARPGQITILDAFNDDSAITATFTLDSTTVTYSSMTTGLSIDEYRLVVSSGSADQLPYVTAHTASATTSTISLAWKKATLATTAFVGMKSNYDLPTDWYKFSSSIRMTRTPYEIPIVDIRDLEKAYPRHRLWLGAPEACAVQAATSAAGYTIPQLHFSHVPTDGPIVVEFEYLFKPTVLTTSLEPTIPLQHRRVLALGAAYLMLIDKNDARQAQVGGMFRDAWDAMAMDEVQLGANNDQYGRLIVFPGSSTYAQPLRTASGQIIG